MPLLFAPTIGAEFTFEEWGHDLPVRGNSHPVTFSKDRAEISVWITPAAMERVLLDRLFSECRNLFLGLSLILRKGHPFANDFSTCFVVVHVRGSLAHLILGGRLQGRRECARTRYGA